MGWQEEEVAKNRAKNEEKNSKNNVREKIALDFWNKLVRANEELLPELRMNLVSTTINYPVPNSPVLDLYNEVSGVRYTVLETNYYYGNLYSFNIHNKLGKMFIGIDEYDHLIASRTEGSGETEVTIYYIIDSNTPKIIIKNLIQNINLPTEGLTSWDYNPKTGRERTAFERMCSIFKA